jgi:steroid delta-isomerase-like uncharacterized protein
MSTEENKAICNRIIDAINTGNMAQMNELISPTAVDHQVPPSMPQTRDSAMQFMKSFKAAFPDLRYTVEFSIAEGDRVVQYATASGTMKGDFNGMTASGKHATWSESHISKLANGKVIEHWAVVDQVSMLQQLGFMPKM